MSFFKWLEKRPEDSALAIRAVEHDTRIREGRQEKLDLVSALSADWLVIDCKAQRYSSLLCLNRNGGNLRLLHYRLGVGFSVWTDVVIPLSEIDAVQVCADDRTETYETEESIPVSVVNRKSHLGRTIAGGIIGGPVGAVVGLGSAMGGRQAIVHETRKVAAERIVKGRTYLVIATQIIKFEVVRVEFESDDAAGLWATRIRQAIATHAKL